ncbi:MAG: transitional endoplasmic reticulum ATPase [Candidatus Woesearchaeota archaeon]|jgi:transitional endoplasmic reticulum ATPase
MTEEGVRLKVAEAIQDDVNKGIVRLDSSFLHKLEVKPGDIVEIEGERVTVCVVDRAYPGDIGLNIIRMDGITRRNAKASIGEYVKLKKVPITQAKKVSIAPSQKGIVVRAPPAIFKQGLLGKAMVKGDIVTLGGTRKRRSTMSANPHFNEMFNVMDETVGGFGLMDLKFIVVDTNPSKTPIIIGPDTELEYNPEAVEVQEDQILEVTYEDVGGLSDEVAKIRELVELPLKHPEIFEQLGIEPPKGILLHGPPGTGKTLLAKAVANETNSNFLLINGPEIMSKFYGESEANLRKKFEDAEKNAPSIIFIDEIDAIATSREESKGEVERRVVAQLLAIMDGLKSRGKVVVIAATNLPNTLDPALRRPGRFDRELEIGAPSKEGRQNILKIHTRGMPIEGTAYSHIFKKVMLTEFSKDGSTAKIAEKIKANEYNIPLICEVLNEARKETNLHSATLDILLTHIDTKSDAYVQIKELFAHDTELLLFEKIQTIGLQEDIDEIADVTHGFVGADLAALSKETAMVVLRKVLPDIGLDKDERIPNEILEKLKLRKEDFFEALKVVRPSALREVLIEMPKTKWEDIGGLNEIKQSLKETVDWPLKQPEVFIRMGVKPPKGVLLYGPPGTGKTLLAKAVANESKANFILVNGPELLSKWVGDSEKAIRKIFEKARQTSPTIIFFDEIDSIAPRRGNGEGDSQATERVVNQLLTELDGLESLANVVVIGATNRPDLLDSALLRPGRFDRIVLAPVPDEESRKKIFELHSKKIPLSADISLQKLAAKSEGYVGADIESLCREAAMLALRKNMQATIVTQENFDEAFKIVRPSVSAEIEKTYENIQEKFRMARSQEMTENAANYFG